MPGRTQDSTGSADRELTPQEGEQVIVSLLRELGPMTTNQITAATQARGVHCPDSTVKFLTKLKAKKAVHGGVDRQKGTWIWWVEGHAPQGGGPK